VASGFNSYQHTFDLPAGTYLVRAEFNNDVPSADRRLAVRDLEVSGAAFDNRSLDFLALAASNTYIDNFRKGNISVALDGLAPGAPVDVRLKRHAFNFGTALNGSNFNGVNSYLGSAGTAKQTSFQQRLLQDFNAVVPGNAGKWGNNEFTRDNPNMSAVDLLLDYAQSHGMTARMHNLIWGDNDNNGQQPGWVLNNTQNGLLDLAATGDAAAAAELRQEISERIAYYVGDGPGGREDQSQRIAELDVYNESFHTGPGHLGLSHNYWTAYGPTGVADIYREAKQAVADSGGIAKMYVNEYNVLGGNDYAQWYVEHIESIRNAGIAAGYGDVVDGIGVQYYPDSAGAHKPSNIIQKFQNLAVQDLPITLTEFGVAAGVDQPTAANILEDTMRLVFGNPTSNGFYMWGFHQESGFGAVQMFRPGAALYTVNTNDFNNWTITPAGVRYEWLFGLRPDPARRGENPSPWETELTTTVDGNGMINFQGFWGDYELTIHGRTYMLKLVKGTTHYELKVVPEPASAVLLLVGGAATAVGFGSRTRRSRPARSISRRRPSRTCRYRRR
jgi:endo-1,4-beta-xylanase